MILIFILLDLVIGDLDIFQFESLGQVRRHIASDLQLLQIIQSRGERTHIDECGQEYAHKEPYDKSLTASAAHRRHSERLDFFVDLILNSGNFRATSKLVYRFRSSSR